MSTSERLSALARASSLLRSGLPSRSVLHEILQIVPAIIPADAYAIWRHDGRQNLWYVAASAGLPEAFVNTAVSGQRDDGVLLRGPFVVDIDTWSLSGERRAFYEAVGIRQMFILPLQIRGEATGTLACCYRTPRVRSANIRNDLDPVKSFLAVPVISRSGEVLGGLFFGHADEGVFTENEEQIVEALAAQAAVAIDNARLYADLARSEARYRSLLMAAPNARAIWIASAEGELTDGFESWFEITGQPAEETRGFGWSRAVHPDDVEGVVRNWRHVLETRTPMARRFRIRNGDGSYRWYAITAVPLLDRDGRVVEWAGTTVDVNEQTLADERLQFLAKTSELLASSLDYETTLKTVAQLAVPEIADWCAVDIADEEGGPHRRLAVAHKDPAKVELAHDLRRRFPPDPKIDTVSRVIRTGRSEWMPFIPPELLRSVDINEDYRQALLALNMVSFITVPLKTHDRAFGAVTFVSSDSNRRFTEADLALAEELARRAVADAAIATVRPLAAAKNIEVLTSFPPDLPPVLGDGARLQQVVWNLVSNAIKFTNRGGSVIVRILTRDASVCIAVRDSGIGISRAFLPHVFEPFRQQDSSTTRAHGGIGLGLAIVRSLVELHGGHITAHSDGEGRGSTFTVELPAMTGVRSGVPSAAKEGELPSLDRVSVLVIDDQKETRDIVAAILRRSGATVGCAESVPEAFAAMHERRPGVIVCDIAIPGEDGYQFVRRLREAGERVPVVALTAFGRPEDRENALASGFDAYLIKPVDPLRLATTVREMV